MHSSPTANAFVFRGLLRLMHPPRLDPERTEPSWLPARRRKCIHTYSSVRVRHTQIANQLQRNDRPYDAGEKQGASLGRGQLYFAVTVAPS
jgi:hypothetical protein